jgi:hypothetical protein
MAAAEQRNDSLVAVGGAIVHPAWTNEAARTAVRDWRGHRHTMRKSIAVLALLLATVAGCGAGSTTTGGSGPTGKPSAQSGNAQSGNAQSGNPAKGNVNRVGQQLRVKSKSGSADVTVLSATANAKGKGDIAEKPANGQYVVVDIQIKSIDQGFEVNPLYVRYQAGDGKTFDTSAGNATTAGFEPVLALGSVPAGQSVRGVVVFDVPAGKGKQVQLTDELGGVIGIWEL